MSADGNHTSAPTGCQITALRASQNDVSVTASHIEPARVGWSFDQQLSYISRAIMKADTLPEPARLKKLQALADRSVRTYQAIIDHCEHVVERAGSEAMLLRYDEQLEIAGQGGDAKLEAMLRRRRDDSYNFMQEDLRQITAHRADLAAAIAVRNQLAAARSASSRKVMHCKR